MGDAYREEQRRTRRNLDRPRKSRRQSSYGDGQTGHINNYTQPVHGTTEYGQPVTAAFGRPGTPQQDNTLLRDGWAGSQTEFYGTGEHDKRHDHYGSGGGTNQNGTERGHYTGYGS